MARDSITVAEKAQEVYSRFDTAWKGNPLSLEGHTAGRVELREKPVLRLRKDGAIMGVSFYGVHLYDAQGREIRVDPTRHIINCPQVPRANLTYDLDGNRIVGDHDPLAAAWEAVGDSLLSAPNPQRFGTRGTVTTVFATDVVDDSIRSRNGTYATARTGGTLSTLTLLRVGQDFNGGPDYDCFEAFTQFDTSGVPDTDTVSGVVLSCDGSTNLSTTDFTANARIFNWGAGVTTADWVDPTGSLGTLVATWASSGYSATYNAFTSEAAFPANINLTGVTYLMLISARHEAGTTPPDRELVIFNDATPAGTSTDPKLDITHAAAGGTVRMLASLGVGV